MAVVPIIATILMRFIEASFGIIFYSTPTAMGLWPLLSLIIIAVSGWVIGAGVIAISRRSPLLPVFLTATVYFVVFTLVWSFLFASFVSIPGPYLPPKLIIQSIIASSAIIAGGLRAFRIQTERLRTSPT
jgi:hypothetical protein